MIIKLRDRSYCNNKYVRYVAVHSSAGSIDRFDSLFLQGIVTEAYLNRKKINKDDYLKVKRIFQWLNVMIPVPSLDFGNGSSCWWRIESCSDVFEKMEELCKILKRNKFQVDVLYTEELSHVVYCDKYQMVVDFCDCF